MEKQKSTKIPFGQRLRSWREAQGLTQTALASQLGVAQPILSRLEQRATPPQMLILAAKLAALGFTLDDAAGNGASR